MSAGIRMRALVSAVAAAVLLTLGLAVPAQAHDALVSSDPADGATVEAVPGEITLTFNNTPVALGGSVAVLDENGENQADGELRIVDTVVTQPLKADAPAGQYRVDWRVVSSDSHPIEGEFTFTAQGAGAGAGAPGTSSAPQEPQESLAPGGTGQSATPVPQSPGAEPGPDVEAGAEADAGQETDTEQTSETSSPVPGIVIGVGVLALIGVVIAMVVGNRRRSRDEEASQTGAPGESDQPGGGDGGSRP